MISNNRISQATSAFFFARNYGLNAATQTQPAEEKVRFDNNLFDGNVFSNQALPDSYTSYSVAFAYVFQNMGYAGDMSAIPGERMPGPGDFLIENNVFKEQRARTDARRRRGVRFARRPRHRHRRRRQSLSAGRARSVELFAVSDG